MKNVSNVHCVPSRITALFVVVDIYYVISDACNFYHVFPFTKNKIHVNIIMTIHNIIIQSKRTPVNAFLQKRCTKLIRLFYEKCIRRAFAFFFQRSLPFGIFI